mmetsp:Transcript_28776/g.51199  ORF Transcript_28776/g.51199 Transcript_28776/m.51199 type:complete len:861 (+) Transcript_28776:25-2607(+)
MNLRLKINLNTLLPLTIGVLIVVSLAIVPIYIGYPDMIDKMIDEMTDDQQMILQTISNQQAYAISNIIYPGIQYVLVFGQLIEDYYSGFLRIKSNFTGEGVSVNLVRLTLGQEVPSDYDPETNRTNKTTMWFDSPYNTTEEQLDETSAQNLFVTKIMTFVMRPYKVLGDFAEVYMAYEHDGMLNYAPAQPKPAYLNFSMPGCSYIEGEYDYYEPRCRNWYIETKNNTARQDVTISDPYVFAGLGFLGLTICRALWFNDELVMEVCIGYSIEQVTSFFTNLEPEQTYNYMLNNNLKVIIHPNLNSTAEDSTYTIQDLEFTDEIEEEIEDFNEKVLPLFKDGKQHLTSYMKNEEDMIAAISTVSNRLSIYGEEQIINTITIVGSKETLQKEIKKLSDDVYSILLAELVIYFSFVAVIILFGWLFSRSIVENITEPLETLALLIERLINNELDLKVLPPEPCAEDIKAVYHALEELRYVLMFTSENVAEAGGTRALLAYSAACNLFERVGNLKGRAVSIYCISRLHFQAGRYKEAIHSIRESIHLAKQLEEKSSDAQLKHFYKSWWEKRTLQMIKIMLVIGEESNPDILDDAIFYLKAARSGQTLSDPTMAQVNVQHALACNLQGNMEEAKLYLVDAEKLMAKFDAPDSLLDFKSYTEGLYYEACGKYKSAATIFTQILERSPKLNPRIKGLCIKHIHQIFKSKGLNSVYLTDHYAGLAKAKDVVMLMDYSLSMEGPRISRVIKGFLHIFDKAIVPEDRVSFIVFNTFPQVIFDLTYKGKNSAFLRTSIELCKHPFGRTGFFDGLKTALDAFKPADDTAPHSLELDCILPGPVVQRDKWVVAFVNGDDNKSTTKFNSVRKMLG